MGNGNGKRPSTVAIGYIPKLAKAGHREDFVLSVSKPSRRYPTPQVQLGVLVNNQNSSPPYEGMTSKGGYFRMSLEQFNTLCAMQAQVAEAYKAAMPIQGEEVSDAAIPPPPDLNILGAGVTGG